MRVRPAALFLGTMCAMPRYALLALFLFCLAPQLPAQTPPVAITGINVVDVVRGEIHYGQTVIIANGIIEAVGPPGQVAIPAAAVRIHGDGRYLLPGLWDMHVHLRGDQKNPSLRLVEENAALLDLFLPNGIVGIREMGGDLADEVIQWREEIRAGKRTGPRILTAGRKIDREPPFWSGSLGVKTPAEAREAVRQVKQNGADFVKIYFNDLSPEVLRALVEEAHKLNLKLTGHKPVNMSIQEFVESGMDGMEHAQYLPAADRDEYERFARDRDRRRNTPWAMDGVETAARLLAMEDNKQSEIVYRRMAEKQFWVTPTLAIGAHSSESGNRDYESDARKRYIFPGIWTTWDPKLGFRTPPQGRALELLGISLKRRSEATLAAHKAGVPMGFAQITPLSFAAQQGDAVVTERLIRHGVPIEEQDRDCITALDWAAMGDRTDTVKALIKLGANINHVDKYGMTPLHHAVRIYSGSTRTLEALLAAGPNLKVRTPHGETARELAARYGHSEFCAILDRHGEKLAAR